jgi:hypothetical protein
LFYRPYDRHLGIPPVDPYYGSGLPRGPPAAVDPYHNYDSYQKYYASRPRDPEFPGQQFVIVFFSEKKILFFSSSDYDLYTNYRNDSYGITNGGHGARRHDLSVDLQPSPGVYPPTHRQHQSYPSASSNIAQYYGIQQR